MEYSEIRAPESEGILPRQSGAARFFMWLFAWLGFVAGGGLVFLSGFQQAFPGPHPPGTGGCGLAVIGGFIAMFIVAPIVALVFALVGAKFGALADLARRDIRRQSAEKNWLAIDVALFAAFAFVIWWCVVALVGRESEPSATAPHTAGCGMAALGVLHLVFITCVSALIALLVRGYIALISSCDREPE